MDKVMFGLGADVVHPGQIRVFRSAALSQDMRLPWIDVECSEEHTGGLGVIDVRVGARHLLFTPCEMPLGTLESLHLGTVRRGSEIAITLSNRGLIAIAVTIGVRGHFMELGSEA